MDKIQKFILKLNKKQQVIFLKIFMAIQKLDLAGYDVKPLTGFKCTYRLRKGKIRVVFAKINDKGVILNVSYRKDAYENL